jgi:hypothetical protein
MVPERRKIRGHSSPYLIEGVNDEFLDEEDFDGGSSRWRSVRIRSGGGAGQPV